MSLAHLFSSNPKKEFNLRALIHKNKLKAKKERTNERKVEKKVQLRGTGTQTPSILTANNYLYYLEMNSSHNRLNRQVLVLITLPLCAHSYVSVRYESVFPIRHFVEIPSRVETNNNGLLFTSRNNFSLKVVYNL